MRPSRASNDEVASMVQKQPQKTSSFRPPDHRDLDFNDDDDLGPAPPHDDQLQDEPMMAGEASPTPPRGLIQTWPKQQIIPADAAVRRLNWMSLLLPAHPHQRKIRLNQIAPLMAHLPRASRLLVTSPNPLAAAFLDLELWSTASGRLTALIAIEGCPSSRNSLK